MEDKILIKSEIDRKVKNFLKWGPLVCFLIAAGCSLVLTSTEVEYTKYRSYYHGWGGYYYTDSYSGWEAAFAFGRNDDIECFLIFLLGAICLLTSIITAIMYLIYRKCELQITENNVKGKSLFGREVVLPLYMISAYSTRKFLSTVVVATSSGVTKFPLLGNYKEIGNVLANKINERQVNTNTVHVVETHKNNNSMDDLIKLKSLLDQGIITQEEFDAKKKQLLGL